MKEAYIIDYNSRRRRANKLMKHHARMYQVCPSALYRV